jgi:hypothetical protein
LALFTNNMMKIIGHKQPNTLLWKWIPKNERYIDIHIHKWYKKRVFG